MKQKFRFKSLNPFPLWPHEAGQEVNMNEINDKEQKPKEPTVIHLAQVEPGLTLAQRRELAEKFADALLSNSETAF
jgi:hypothetical protein